MFGFDLFYVVNEGFFIVVVVVEKVDEVLVMMWEQLYCENVVIIGEVIIDYFCKIVFISSIGGKCVVNMFIGE